MTSHTMRFSDLFGPSAGCLALAVLLLAACGGAESPPASTGADEHAEVDDHADENRVALTAAALRSAGIIVSEVRGRGVPQEGRTGMTVPGQVEFDPARVALVSPRTPGRIERLTVVEGDEVRAGQPVAFVLSPTFLTAQHDFLQASRRADLLSGTGDEPEALALLEAARRRLDLMGADSAVIRVLNETDAPIDLLPVTAPFGGSIVTAHTLAGAAVEPGSPIFTLADLSMVDVVADVPEGSLSTLRAGQSAHIELAAYADDPVQGTVVRIGETLDPNTRTARAIIRVANPRRLLRPGMFASVRLMTDDAAEGATVLLPTLPAGAVVTSGAERYVFVEVEPGTFERRLVDVYALDDGQVAVRSGVVEGERVVVQGAFTLSSELAKGEFGDEH